jgi:peptide/nickel transport system permease protein
MAGGALAVREPRERRGMAVALRAPLSFARNDPGVTVAFVILALLVVMAVFPGLIATQGPNTADLTALRESPSLHHLFGTDALGRDVFSRVVYGARITLVVGLLSMLVGAVLGGIIGLIAGYAGGPLDTVLMRFSDIMLAFPGILLALAIVAAAGPNERDLVLAVGISVVPGYAKLMRNQARSVKERGYVEASRASGSRRRTVLLGHVLPNTYSPLLGFATLGIGFSILIASSLSFLGLGPPPPSPEWGAMVSDGAGQISTTWWMSLFPGLAIAVSVLVVGVIGQWLRRHFDLRSGE